MTPPAAAPARKLPTRIDAAIFRGKTLLLQAKRAAADAGWRLPVAECGSTLAGKAIISESKTPLWTETDPRERFLLAGKIQNLRLAVRRIDGLEFAAGQTFSFWRQVGRASRLKGYVEGRELREGCIIPNVGGGLCQLSNALFDAAVDAGFEIVERHAHTQVVPGSLAEKGRDATVFWNYVDLRFRSERPFRIEARLDDKDLIVAFRGEKQAAPVLHAIRRVPVHNDSPRSCATCEMGDCHRVVEPTGHRDFGRTAYLVDEYSPEFDAYIQGTRSGNDLMLAPLDGKRFRKANYAWTTTGFARYRQSLAVTAVRSYRSRKLAEQGKARQLNLLAMYEKLAESYAGRLSYDVLHLVVQQNILPFLWRSGHLGGRTFDVLMTALPMAEIQRRLDRAARLHPESTTLSDFRADEGLIQAETEALKQARRIITPHTGIANLFPNRSERISWKLPEPRDREEPPPGKFNVVFPASTVGRKGCYELRESLRGLDVRITLLGPLIESADFWQGFDTHRGGDDWLRSADLVALPAHVEHRPRRLLLAAASGIPVIASDACGIEGLEGVETIEAGDPAALRAAIIQAIAASGSAALR
jgi:hypothetical protein